MQDAQGRYPWEAHYPEGIDWREQFTGRPLYTLLDKAAERWPNHIALEFFGRCTSYALLQEKVNRIAHGLQKLGVKKGTRVGLLMPNCPQFVMAYFAILKCGGTVVNFNPLYSNDEVSYQLGDARVEVMFTTNLHVTYDKLIPFIGKGQLRHVVVCHFAAAMGRTKRILYTAAKGRDIAHPPHDDFHIWLHDLLQSPAEIAAPDIAPDTDLAVLQYTGGTTGVPKGACLTHSNLYINTLQASRWMVGLEPGNEKMLAVIPFFHVFAMTVAMNMAIANGMHIVIHPRFDLKMVLHDIAHKKPTLMPGVSTLYATINNYKSLDKYDLSSIKMCISGGGPLPIEVKQKFEALTGCALVEGYGLTESSPVTHCNPLRGLQKTGSIGVPLPGTIVEIIDPNDHVTEMPIGEVGELCIRGPQVMQGYLDRPEETALVLRNGRLHTGDLAKLDEDGYCFIVDRLKEMIIVGGYKVYPRHVEEVLYMHPAIAEAAVVGLPHARRGQMIKAYVVLKDGQSVSEEALREFLKQHVTAYSIPHEIEFRASLPKSMIGKILKKELVKEALAKGNVAS